MKPLKTKFSLLPGILSLDMVRELLRLAFEEFRWFTPVRYGFAFLDNPIQSNRFDDLLAFYEDRKVLYVAARTDRDFIAIHPSTSPDFPYAGSVSWTTTAKSASKPTWRAAHEIQVKQFTLLLGSPLASTAFPDDFQRKTRRWVRREVGSEQVITVRDYSEGLAGLYWRNFFGPPFVRMFGERLHSLPVECRRELGDGIVLVEPYPLPGDAETEAGAARERELIEHLGRECFYDHERHTLPARRPDIPPPVPSP